MSSRVEESVTSIYSNIFSSLIPLKELFSVVHNYLGVTEGFSIATELRRQL